MTSVTRYTTTTAAATEVDARARRYVSEHQGSTYQEAMSVVLKSDKDLAAAYAAPAVRRRVSTMATADARSQPAVPVPADVEREILDWVVRALDANMAGSLPGAMGQISVEADRFAKGGMRIEEAARRAMDAHPHLVAMARLLLTDVRRNAPENKPSEDTLGQAPGAHLPPSGNPAGFEVHARAEKLQQADPSLDYRSAVHQVLDEDRQLKIKYAGVK